MWCGNDAARDAFGVGPIEGVLPLSDATRRRLEELTAWRDTALDWDDPAGPTPWSPEENERFERAATLIRASIQAELGPEFQVRYSRL